MKSVQQLPHSEWGAEKGRSVPRVLYGFGGQHQLDEDAVRRLVASLLRLLELGEGPAAQKTGQDLGLARAADR